MTFQDLLNELSVEPPMRFLTIATTGVHDGDEIMAACATTLENGQFYAETVFRSNVPVDRARASQEFHKITPERLAAEGLSDEEFKEKLKLFTQGTVFTYNPSFQRFYMAKLEPFVEDRVLNNLPLLMLGAEMREVISSKDAFSLATLQHHFFKTFGNNASFKRLKQKYDLCDQPSPMLPLQSSCAMLTDCYQLATDIPVQIQEVLF